jgi:LysM repeat protein
MAARPEHSPARFLAPLALAGCVVALLAVVVGSESGDDSGGSARTASQAKTAPARAKQRTRRAPRRSTYTVKTGDTLAGIAEKTDVSIARLQELNPELDPQALVSGQKIKLRE